MELENQYSETLATWDTLAAIYEEKFMNLDIYNDSYDLFCDKLPASDAKVLDVGSGPGNIARYLLSKRPDFTVTCIDTSPNMLALAKANNPTASCVLMDSREIATLEAGVHGIACGFCIPYLSLADCAKFIADCRTLLREGGVLYLSFVDGAAQQSGFQTGRSGARVYFYYHPLATISNLLADAGIEVIHLLTVPYTRASGDAETHTIVIARKG